jgi:pimeloyl-ACP methyl ester carboxylesterase
VPVASVNGIEINYRTAGQGEPLVMIQGFSSNQSGWYAQVPFFKKYFQVVTFDNRGVGRSGKPAGPYTTRMMADDTAALMDCLGLKKAHILGISMGGMIAQEFAINHPERVNKLVLAATFSCKEGSSGDAPEQVEALKLSPSRMARRMIDLALNKPLYRLTGGLLAKIQLLTVKPSDRIGLDGQKLACNSHNTLTRLRHIKVPTLVIVGTQDHIIKPSSSDVIASQIPHARIVKVEGGSHALNMEHKNLFNQTVMEFLQNKNTKF